MLQTWVAQDWTPEGIKCLNVLFHFVDGNQAQRVLSKGPWTVMRSLLVMCPYSKDFSVDEEASLEVLVWMKFLDHPDLWWPYLKDLVYPLGSFVCLEPVKIFSPRPNRRMCVKVNLSCDLEESIKLQLKGGEIYRQRVVYINLPNTYFRCQSSAHKIKDYPLMEGRVRPQPQSTPPPVSTIPFVGAQKGSEGWTTCSIDELANLNNLKC